MDRFYIVQTAAGYRMTVGNHDYGYAKTLLEAWRFANRMGWKRVAGTKRTPTITMICL